MLRLLGSFASGDSDRYVIITRRTNSYSSPGGSVIWVCTNGGTKRLAATLHPPTLLADASRHLSQRPSPGSCVMGVSLRSCVTGDIR